MSARQDELLEQYRDNLLGVFGDPSLVLVSGEGVHVTDANGYYQPPEGAYDWETVEYRLKLRLREDE